MSNYNLHNLSLLNNKPLVGGSFNLFINGFSIEFILGGLFLLCAFLIYLIIVFTKKEHFKCPSQADIDREDWLALREFKMSAF